MQARKAKREGNPGNLSSDHASNDKASTKASKKEARASEREAEDTMQDVATEYIRPATEDDDATPRPKRAAALVASAKLTKTFVSDAKEDTATMQDIKETGNLPFVADSEPSACQPDSDSFIDSEGETGDGANASGAHQLPATASAHIFPSKSKVARMKAKNGDPILPKMRKRKAVDSPAGDKSVPSKRVHIDIPDSESDVDTPRKEGKKAAPAKPPKEQKTKVDVPRATATGRNARLHVHEDPPVNAASKPASNEKEKLESGGLTELKALPKRKKKENVIELNARPKVRSGLSSRWPGAAANVIVIQALRSCN